MKKRKPVVKLLKLFALEKNYETTKVSQLHISNGVWSTVSVEEKTEGSKDFKRIYTLQCVVSWHKDLNVGEFRRMYEDAIICLCDEMKLIRLKSMNIHKKRILKKRN